jgi:hypothetical protein
VRCLQDGGLAESAGLDGKCQLDKNADLAVDVAAMTVNGGLLLVGVGENDERTHLVKPCPIALAGQAERVTQIVSTSISEPPVIDVRALPLPDDPARGFLAILVPASS